MEGLFAALAFVIPAIVLIVMARRFVALARNLRDPKALEQRLKMEVDQVLARAGVDPDSISEEDPEALKRVTAEASHDIHKAVLRTLFEVENPPRSADSSDLERTVQIGQYAVGGRPTPIDEKSRSRSSLLLVAVVLSFVVGALLLVR